MTTRAKNQSIEQQIEELHTQAVSKHKQNRLQEALALYLQSIELDEEQPEWIYANAITIAAQIRNYVIASNLMQKAQKLHADSDEVCRATGIFFHKLGKLDKAREAYQKSIAISTRQPEWVYLKLLELLIRAELYGQATEIEEIAVREFPHSKSLKRLLDSRLLQNGRSNRQRDRIYTDTERKQLFQASESRGTPQDIEQNVDLDLKRLRRKLTDSAIVDRYSILLDQMLCHVSEGKKVMDVDALVHCLAEIKTDIHYLKTKVLNPPVEAVDPQAKQNVDLDTITGLNKPILIKCELKERIVGSGWYDAEEHGRWTGPGRLSSVVLSNPAAGDYRFEMVIRAEARQNLLQTLNVNINDRPLDISIIKGRGQGFPAIVRGEITIPPENQPSFLAIDLVIDETVVPLENDSRLIGLLVEKISLIPCHTTI